MFVSPSLSLLHPLPHHSQQSASCPLLLKFHPEISHREQSVPVVGTRPCVCVFFCFFFVIFFSLFLSWSMKICSTFCHPFLHLLSPPGAALLFFFCLFFFPTPSLLLSISIIFISASLCLSAISQFSTHTKKGSVSTTCHHWHSPLTSTLGYFCELPAGRILLTCQTSEQREGKRIPPSWTDGSQLAPFGTALICSSSSQFKCSGSCGIP